MTTGRINQVSSTAREHSGLPRFSSPRSHRPTADMDSLPRPQRFELQRDLTGLSPTRQVPSTSAVENTEQAESQPQMHSRHFISVARQTRVQLNNSQLHFTPWQIPCHTSLHSLGEQAHQAVHEARLADFLTCTSHLENV